MAFDFNKLSPWKDIEDVLIDGQEMVRIPKFYIKTGKNLAGHNCWWVSPNPDEGFHVHPAFMHDGKELDQFYIGKYEAWNAGNNMAGCAANKTPWVSINFINARAFCEYRNHDEFTGWHLQNYYERSAINILCMLEIGTPDVQAKLGAGRVSTNALAATGTDGAKWRGICGLWGNVWEHCDGFRTANDGQTVLVQDNLGYGKWVNTGVKIPATDAVGINEMYDTVGDEFDLGDMFIPKSVGGGVDASVFHDIYNTATGDTHIMIMGGNWGNGSGAGLFALYMKWVESSNSGDVGFRLAKW